MRFWLFFSSVFRFLRQKTSVFRFCCSLRFVDFPFSTSVFRFSSKFLTSTRIWYPMHVLFRFFQIFQIKVPVFDLSSSYTPLLISNSRETYICCSTCNHDIRSIRILTTEMRKFIGLDGFACSFRF